MGTKIDFSINLIPSSVDHSKNLNVCGVDVWKHYQNSELNCKRPKTTMIDRNNIESIKKTMQMHENIFKHQVRELHRVYSIQRMLMDEHKKENKQQKYQTLIKGIDISHPHFTEQQHQTTQFSYEPNFHVQSLNMERGFDLERPAEKVIFTRTCGFDEGEAGPSSYNNTSFQTCKISTSGYDEEMEVDLTLSIGSSKVKKSNVSQLACLDSPNEKTREGECSDPTTPIMSSSNVIFTQERKGPCWLSQWLKLK